MNRNIKTNNNSKLIEKIDSIWTPYIHPKNPSQTHQTVDNLKIRQNYGPINSTHFAEMIYHNVDSKIRVFPTRKLLWNQKDKFPKYDERAKIGPEMTNYLRKTDNSGVSSGWRGYETEPERNILKYSHAVKTLNNIRFSDDPEISIYDDIKTFFTRFDVGGRVVDTESLKQFDDLKDVVVDKVANRKQMFEKPAEFISELRYNLFHAASVSSSHSSRSSFNAATCPMSEDIEPDEEEGSVLSAASVVAQIDDQAEEQRNANADLIERVLDLENQVSDLKEDIFTGESRVTELSGVIHAVLEVTSASLKVNELPEADIVVYDRIFSFKSGVRSQVYKIKQNQHSNKEICGCYQCELQRVCTLTQKILKLGTENCQLDTRQFKFGRNENGHVRESTLKQPKTIELTELTSENKIVLSNENNDEERLSVSININSHDSKGSSHRSVKIDNEQSTPIKRDNPAPKILIPAETDNIGEITRPTNYDSDASSQFNFSDVISTHEDMMSSE